MKSFKSFVLAALVLLASACGGNTLIEGNLHEGADKDIVVKFGDFEALHNINVHVKEGETANVQL